MCPVRPPTCRRTSIPCSDLDTVDDATPLPITEGDFEALARACDGLLTHPSTPVSTMATPLLHVLSSHPVHMAGQLAILKGHGRTLGRRLEDAVRHARNVLRGVSASPVESLPPRDVVLVGGLVHPDHLERNMDFYFGGLAKRLADRGLTSLHLLRNQAGLPTMSLNKRAWRDGDTARRMLFDSLSASDEIAMLRQVKDDGRIVGRLRIDAETDIGRRIRTAARWAVASPSTIGNLRLERQVEDVCRRVGAKALIVMYEGHAWERCALRGARRANSAILGVGYQHTILRKHAHALRRSLPPCGDPDVVLCLGHVTREDLEDRSNLYNATFLVYGTHRNQGEVAHSASDPGVSGCLVLPEGIEDEAVLMFRCALAAARLMPQRRFILRSHPVLPFETIMSRIPALASPPPNVERSRGSTLDEDLAKCGTLLYRGSSTVLYGILAGLKPFYLERPGELTLDPVHALDCWRETVRDAPGLVAALAGSSQEDAASEWERARDFCLRYTLSEQGGAVDTLAAMIRRGADVRH